MTPWLADTDSAATLAATSAASGRDERALRAADVLLATALALPALPLLAAARLLGARWTGRWQRGDDGAFQRWSLEVPPGARGTLLRALGLRHAPVLWNVLRGEMAWVGPRPRALTEPPGPASACRPGVVHPWWLRQRTAVHFGTEAQADRDYLARRGLGHDLGLLLRSLALAWLPAPEPAAERGAPASVQIHGVALDNLTLREAVDTIVERLDGDTPQQVCFVNPACVNIAARHRAYRRTLAQAHLVLADGIGMRIASVLQGTPLKQNVNGTDLFPRLCEALQQRGARLYLLGGQPGVAEAVAAEIGRRWPGLRVVGCRDGYFALRDEGEVAARVRASGADVLLVARGVPAQDLFIARHLPLLGVRVALGVGGLFDFVSGRIPRAPQWMREAGLEWVWRLRQEPARMWKRYLVGNLTFLARVLMTRRGRAAAHGPRTPAENAAAGPAVATQRAVVFATSLAAPDVPVAPGTPTALLTLGHQTVIEHWMDRLSAAGIADVDVVACDRPEALRDVLGDGSRWGLRLRWQLVKSPLRPYAALAAALRATSERLLIAHAEGLPEPSLWQRLLREDGVAFEADPAGALRWAGLACARPAQLAALQADLDVDRDALAVALCASGPAAVFGQVGSAADAAGLLAAQQRLLAEPDLGGAPASWIRHEWGAMSPTARVDEGAVVRGPVLIGPGTWVQRGASVGPDVVLGGDVLVSSGTQLRQALVLSGTYLGPDLEVDRAIVQGPQVQHLALGVRVTLPQNDGLALPLQSAPVAGRRALAPRLGAALAWTLAAPVLLGHRLLRQAQRRAPAWVRREVVTARCAETRRPLTAPLITARREGTRADAAWAALAALSDVARGRRAWFGVRPRSVGEWYALHPAWQDLLAGQPVGVLVAPAAPGDAHHAAELGAAADVHGCTVSSGRRMRAWWSARRHA